MTPEEWTEWTEWFKSVYGHFGANCIVTIVSTMVNLIIWNQIGPN